MPTLHFLVVSDDCDTRFLLGHALQRRHPGAHVTECWNAAEAERAAGGRNFDVIIAHRGVNVPVPQMVRRLRIAAPAQAILAVSGNASDEPLVTAAGATAFLDLGQWTFIGDAVRAALDAQPVRATPPEDRATLRSAA